MEGRPSADSARASDYKKAISFFFQYSLKKNKWLPLQVSNAVIESQPPTEPAVTHTAHLRVRAGTCPADTVIWEGAVCLLRAGLARPELTCIVHVCVESHNWTLTHAIRKGCILKNFLL